MSHASNSSGIFEWTDNAQPNFNNTAAAASTDLDNVADSQGAQDKRAAQTDSTILLEIVMRQRQDTVRLTTLMDKLVNMHTEMQGNNQYIRAMRAEVAGLTRWWPVC